MTKISGCRGNLHSHRYSVVIINKVHKIEAPIYKSRNDGVDIELMDALFTLKNPKIKSIYPHVRANDRIK